uniref:Uncharacterized protein n=1 Tax=Anguilla anguilla TaxID=7936 RepID=A0A0E9TE84_ANGAN
MYGPLGVNDCLSLPLVYLNARYCTGCPEINRFGSLCKNCTFLPWKVVFLKLNY